MSDWQKQKFAENFEGLGAVLEMWGLKIISFQTLDGGLINESFKVDASNGGTFVLQKISSRFSTKVTKKIHRLTPYLESCGLKTFHILESKQGHPYELHNGNFWRLLSFLEGNAPTIVETTQQASEAGGLLARFHLALAGYEDEDFKSMAVSHDIHLHLKRLEAALSEGKEGPHYSEVRERAQSLFEAVSELPPMKICTKKVLHGDPKISNFLFSADGKKAECIVDLDTVGPGSLPLELGDAFRSWCNPSGEDEEKGTFDSNLFRSAFESYIGTAGNFFSEIERQELVLAILYVYYELSARFLLDVLEESNFGWDSTRFSSSAKHNLVRAKGQFAAGLDLVKQFNFLSRYASNR